MINVLIALTIIGIMFAMGLELSMKDFARVIELPRAVVVGLLSQLVLLPALSFLLAWAIDAPPEVAAGMVILAACPGGPPSNVLSYLAGAHIALSVTLTALSSVLTVVTLPLVVNLGLATFYDGPAQVRLPVLTTLAQLTVISILPIAAGIWVRARWSVHVERVQEQIKRLSLAGFTLAAVIIIYETWDEMVVYLPAAALASALLCWAGLAAGYAAAWTAGLDARDRFTIGLETGVQNIALASLVVMTQLERPELIPVPSTYAIVSFPSIFFAAAVYAFVTKRRSASE